MFCLRSLTQVWEVANLGDSLNIVDLVLSLGDLQSTLLYDGSGILFLITIPQQIAVVKNEA